MRNFLSIVSIIGATIAIVGIVVLAGLSVLFLTKTHPLVFNDASGNSADGEVYLNNNFIGKTIDGKVFIENFTTGDVKIIVHKDGKSYENNFELTQSDADYDVTFKVAYTKEDEIPNPSQSGEYSRWLQVVRLHDDQLRLEATTATKGCLSGDKECQLIGIFEHVLSQYKYISDPRAGNPIQNPESTIKYGGGDCDDLSILLASLLENGGISTYLVFTPGHAFVAACGIDPVALQKQTEQLFLTTKTIDNFTIDDSLESYTAWYYGGNNSFNGNVEHVSFSIDSTEPVTMFAVSKKEDYQAFMKDEPYDHIYGTYFEGVRKQSVEADIPNVGGLVLFNSGYKTAKVTISVNSVRSYYIVDPKDVHVTSYNIAGETCVPLDPSTGEMGYAGLEADHSKNKIFVNTLTGEKHEIN